MFFIHFLSISSELFCFIFFTFIQEEFLVFHKLCTLSYCPTYQDNIVSILKTMPFTYFNVEVKLITTLDFKLLAWQIFSASHLGKNNCPPLP